MHEQFEFQRWATRYLRTPRYHRPVIGKTPEGADILGDEMKHPKAVGPGSRVGERGEKRELTRRFGKRPATMTRAQRAATERELQRKLSVERIDKADQRPVLHPDNLYIPLPLRRKLRKQGKGKLLIAKPKLLVPARKAS